MDLGLLNENIINALGEVANIGSGSAATALGNMICKKIDMAIPSVRVLDFIQVPEILGGAEEIVVAVYFKFNKDISGNIMFVLDEESAIKLSQILYPRDREIELVDKIDLSIISELGNIVVSSYITALSKLTGFDILVSIPSISIDMSGAILSVAATQLGMMADHALMIETKFICEDTHISGNFFLLPSVESFDKILGNLGVI